MTDQTYPPSADMVSNAHVDAAKYAEMYKASVSDPDTFWADNPPPAARNGGDPRRFGAGGGVWVMLLLALARGSGRRRQT